MKYNATHFLIHSTDEALRQTARELLADALGRGGYESFMDTDEGLDGYVQQARYGENAVRQAIAELPLSGVSVEYRTEAVPDQDWNEAWEAEGFAPITVDGRLTVYDAYHTDEAELPATPIKIGIQARNAFGTGTHETTQMMLSAILAAQPADKRVLDCGCGTGILSIAALKLGAAKALGYDIDEWSAENAKHNAALNGVADGMEVLCGDAGVLSGVSGGFDLILANINRNILLADMERLRSEMSADATLLVSGFYDTDAPSLIEKAVTLGLRETMRRTNSGWCCISFSINTLR